MYTIRIKKKFFYLLVIIIISKEVNLEFKLKFELYDDIYEYPVYNFVKHTHICTYMFNNK